MSTLRGRPAPPGSTIAIVTPGSPAESRAQVQRGIAPICLDLALLGVQATLDADAMTLTIDEAALAG